MDNPTISAPVEGLVFDNNESVNAVDNNSTVTNPATAEASQQPVFAVTKGNIGTAVGWTSSQIAEALAAARYSKRGTRGARRGKAEAAEGTEEVRHRRHLSPLLRFPQQPPCCCRGSGRVLHLQDLRRC